MLGLVFVAGLLVFAASSVYFLISGKGKGRPQLGVSGQLCHVDLLCVDVAREI